jgi:hypothetical protein
MSCSVTLLLKAVIELSARMLNDCTFHTVPKSPLRSLVKLIVGNLQSRYGAVRSNVLIV